MLQENSRACVYVFDCVVCFLCVCVLDVCSYVCTCAYGSLVTSTQNHIALGHLDLTPESGGHLV